MSPTALVVLDSIAPVSVSKLTSAYKAALSNPKSSEPAKKEADPDAKPTFGSVSALKSQFKDTKFMTPEESAQIAGKLNIAAGYGAWAVASVGRYERESTGSKSVIFEDTRRYNLEYVGDEKINSKGAFTYSNGDRYDGEWKNNRHHGKGVMQYENGDR